MNTLYQKSTKINIFHAHTFYRYVYMYIFYMQTLLSQSTATTRLVSGCRKLIGAIQVWQLTMRILGNIMYALKRQQRGCKKRGEKGNEQLWSGSSVTGIDPCEAGGGLDNLRSFFMFYLRIGVTQGHGFWLCTSRWCVSVGLGVRVSKTVEEGERQSYSIQKDTSFAFQFGYNVCMHWQRNCGFPLLYFLE